MTENRQTVSIAWKAVAKLAEAPDLTASGPDFNVIPNPRLYSQFSVPLHYGFIPYKLSPTAAFYEVLLNKLSREHPEISIKNRKFPLRLSLSNKRQQLGRANLNINIRLFQPDILSVTVALYEFEGVESVMSATELIELQALNAITPVNEIVRWIFAVATSLDHRRLPPMSDPPSKPAVLLLNVEKAGDDLFERLVKLKQAEYVGILIRNQSFRTMRPQIPEAVYKKNLDINLKSSKELMLIDKQGILFLTADADEKTVENYKSRLSRTHDLFEVALVFQRFLNSFFEIRSHYEDFAYFILDKIRYWFEFPQLVFTQSVTNQHYWKLLVAELNLAANFERVVSDNSVLETLERKRDKFNMIKETWWLEKNCPFELPNK